MPRNSKIKVGPFLLVCTILFIHFPLLLAQQDQFLVETIPLKGEMVNFSGSCFLQDSEGFIWFGSKDGLYRYSGNGLKVFRNDLSTPGSLASSNIYSLYEDSRGVIWVGTRVGLHCYNKNSESFRYFQPLNDSSGPASGQINVIMEDEEGLIWFATTYGFSCFDWKSESFRNYIIARREGQTGKNNYQIYGLYSDRRGFLWLHCDDGLYRFEKATGSLNRFEGPPFFTWSIYEDRSGRCWLINDHGLYLFNIQDQSYERYLDNPGDPNRLHHENIRSMTEDHEGNIWIRTLDGLYCYSQDLIMKFFLEHDRVYPYTFDMEEITQDLLVDKAGSIWYYTPDGIKQIISRSRNFKVYDSHETTLYFINCIHVESKDRIWYGSVFGISSLDRGRNSYHLHFGGGWESGHLYETECMYMDRHGTLWISLWHQGLFSMNSSSDQTGQNMSLNPGTLVKHPLNSEGLFKIRHLFEDSIGRLWVGTWNEEPLRFLDSEKNIIVHLVDNPDSEEKLPSQAMVMQETTSGCLWALGSYGAFKIIPPFTWISNSELMPTDVIKTEGIPPVQCSYLDSTSTLWLGTNNHGLIRYSGQNLSTYTEAQGLAGNQVMSILPDERGNLWISTFNGLSKFNIQSGTFTNFYKRHGLPINQFQPGSATRGKDGELFFGTRKGMISFYPDSISTNQNVPPVKLTGFKIHNRSVTPGEGSPLSRSISKTEKIELKHKQDHLSIEFAILNFQDPELNQYKYMLEGLDQDWIYSGSMNFAIYSNLDPGNYTFHVKGANNDGIWNEDGTSLDIRILPPLWFRWWALIIECLLAISILITIIRFREGNLKQQSMMLEQQVQEKTHQILEQRKEVDEMKSRFYTNISHEFRTPLTLLISPLEDAMKQGQGKIEINKRILSIMHRNARRLQNLINQLLDISRIESGKMELQLSKANLSDLVRVVASSFYSLAESRQIHYQIDIEPNGADFCFDIDKTEKVIMNLLSNAFKFCEDGGYVSLELEFVNSVNTYHRQAVLKVRDNGKGMEEDQLDKIFDRFYQVSDNNTREVEGSGIGLALTRELLELMHGIIVVESTHGKGTSFQVTFPISEECFSEQEIMTLNVGESFEKEISGDEIEQVIHPESVAEIQGEELILVVEDNPDLRLYIIEKISLQYKVIEAENGETGLQKAIEQIPDLVITDVMMPVMDGVEFCRKLKQHPAINHIPVIMLTAKADKDSRLEGLEAAADDYIIKPFDSDLLFARVRNLISQRNELRNHFEKELVLSGDEVHAASPQFRKLREIVQLIDAHLDDFDFELDSMASLLNMSRRGLFRKIKSISGMTPQELVRMMRMKRAAAMLRRGELNVTEVMYQVGIKNLSHFALSFRKYFGVNPGEYRNHKSG